MSPAFAASWCHMTALLQQDVDQRWRGSRGSKVQVSCQRLVGFSPRGTDHASADGRPDENGDC